MSHGETGQTSPHFVWGRLTAFLPIAVKWFTNNTSIPLWLSPRFRTYEAVYLLAAGGQSLALVLQLLLVKFIPGYNFPALLFTLSLILIALELGDGPALVVACVGFLFLDISLNPAYLSPRTWLGDSMGFLVQLGIIIVMTLFASHAGKSRRDAEAMHHQQEAFLHIASHELRTPLTSLTLRAHFIEKLLQRTPDEALDPRVRAIVTSQQQYLAQLNRLIGDMLDISRIQTGKLSLRLARWDLVQVIQEVVTDYQHLYPHRLIHLEQTDHPIWGMVDKDRISQVVVNLLANAIRYAPDEQPVDVAIQQRADDITVSVTDHGPGIGLDDQKKIWEWSYQVRNHTQSPSEGLGLGLFISQTIVELHQGRIEVHSQLGEGATFQFILPVMASPVQ
jgi:signal transduction histidine kinase